MAILLVNLHKPLHIHELSYNASFVILTEDYTLRQVQLDQPSAVGKVVYDSGSGQDYCFRNRAQQ